MKKIFILFFFLLLISNANSNGVGVVNASLGTYLKLTGTKIETSVQLQISITKTSQTFYNNLGSDKTVAYAFPLPDGASGIGLKWKLNGEWHTAPISPTPQDTSLPGGTMNSNLRTYLGAKPMFFSIPDQVKRDSTLIVEMTYVQFLKYDFGSVFYNYQNDYRLIQNQNIESQELSFNLTSPRTIDSIRLVSLNPITQLTNNGNSATVISNQYSAVPSVDFKIKYSLNLNELGLYSYSTIDFETYVYQFRNRHVLYTPQSRDCALQYVASISAGGSTNISGAFSSAVPQFNAANDSTANIIIFLTDGMPTVGITERTALLSHVHNLITSTETEIFLYSFGIGTDVDQQLLTLMSSQNNGYAEFLLNDELESRITNFYLRIKNPVLLSPTVTFSSPNINNVYPSPLPNLYIGQQMIVAGRYTETGPLTVTLSGRAFNQPVSYQYNFNRNDSADTRYQFLTKVWAKQKIENLLIQYYSLNPVTPEAIALKQQIIQLSIDYGVISPFTSFGNPNAITGPEETIVENSIPGDYKLLSNYPNPFNPQTTIKLIVDKNFSGIAMIKIYNSAGILVDFAELYINGNGVYEFVWKAEKFSSGVYFYSVDFGD